VGQKNYIECPFCSGLLEPKLGRQTCPECHAGFVYDAGRHRIFVDTNDIRLPIQGIVCTRCGMVQSENARRCAHCRGELLSTKQ